MNIDINVVGNAKQALDNIRLASARATESISSFSKSLATQAKQSQRASDSLLSLVGQYVAVSKGIDLAKNSISDFTDLQEKTLDIAKTTGLAGRELDNFTDSLDSLSQNVRGMQLDNLYGISAIAGQLGIKGQKNLLDFTQSVQRIAKTSTLTAQQAGEGFAKLANSLQEPISNIEKLASTFTILASSTTASEEKLLDFTQRLAGAGKTLGLTTAQIAGIGATLNDVGLSAEVAGTAMSQIFQKILTDTDKFIYKLNLNATEFRDAIQNEPIEAVEMLLQAIGKLDKGARIQALKDLQLAGSGLSSTLLKLSSNTNKLTANLEIASRGYQEGTYTIAEFNIATSGLATTQQQLSDQVKLTSASFGKLLAPAVESVSQTFIVLLKDIQAHNEGIATAGKVILGLGVVWKGLNVIMSASPFGRVVAGITAVLGVAIKLRATLLQNRELLAQGKKLYEQQQAYKRSDAFRLDTIKKLKKQEEQYLTAILSTQKILTSNKNITAKQKEVISENLAKQGQKLNSLILQREELEKQVKITSKIPKEVTTKIKIKSDEVPKINIPKIKPVNIKINDIKVPKIHIPKPRLPKLPKLKPIQIRTSKISTKGVEEYADKSKTLLNRTLEDVNKRFEDEFLQNTLNKFEYRLKKIKEERDDWISKGVSADKAKELYNAKLGKLLDDYFKQGKKELSLKAKQLKTEKKINKELEKQQKSIKVLVDDLKGLGSKIFDSALSSFAKTGSINVDDALSSNDFKQANDPYLKAIGYTADIINGLLSNQPDEFYMRETNVKADNISVVDAIDKLKNDVMINQLDETRKMLIQLQHLNASFKNISVALAPNGTYLNNPNLGDETTEYNQTGVSIAGFAQDIIGNNFVSDIVGGLARGLFGSTTKKVEHAGLVFGQQTVSDFLDGVSVQSYQDIKKSKKALFGLIDSTSYDTKYSEVDTKVKEFFKDSVKNQSAVIKRAGVILGADMKKLNDRIASYRIDIGKLDLLGKDQNEINNIIAGVLGNQLSGMTKTALPILNDFKRSSEEYTDTLIRVASGYEKAKVTLSQMSIDVVKLKEISDKNGDVYAETIRDSLLRNEEISRTLHVFTTPQIEPAGRFDTGFSDNVSGLSALINSVLREAEQEAKNIDYSLYDIKLTGIGEIIKEMVGTGDEIVSAYKLLADQQIKLRSITANITAEVNKDLLSNFSNINEFAQLQNSFYDSFVSDEQKIKDLRESLKSVLDVVPATKEQYLQLVKNQDLTTEEGRKKYADLLRSQNAYLELIKLQEASQDTVKDSVKSFTNEWQRAMESVRDKIQSTIDSIRGNYKKDESGRIQALSDFSRYRDLLTQSINAGNKEDIDRYSTLFSNTARSLAGFGDEYKNLSLRELERIKEQLPEKEEIQKVEVVADAKGIELQEAIYNQLDANSKDNSEIKLLLTRIFNELNYQNEDEQIKLIKG